MFTRPRTLAGACRLACADGRCLNCRANRHLCRHDQVLPKRPFFQLFQIRRRRLALRAADVARRGGNVDIDEENVPFTEE